MPLEFLGVDPDEVQDCDLAKYALDLEVRAAENAAGASPDEAATKRIEKAKADLAAYKPDPGSPVFVVGHILEAQWARLEMDRRAWAAMPEGAERAEAYRVWNRALVRLGIKGHRQLFAKKRGGGAGKEMPFVAEGGVVSEKTLEVYFRSGIMAYLSGMVFRAQGLGEDLPNG